MRRYLVTAPLRRGSEDAVRRILREGPPFQLPDTTLERHLVFLAGAEIVFLFEGPHADVEARRLFHDHHVLSRAGRLAEHLAGPPRMPHEVFSWERPELLEGLSFAPQPGPGDSEGGPIG